MKTSGLSGFVLWWPLSSGQQSFVLWLRQPLCCTVLIFLPLEPPLSGHPLVLCCWLPAVLILQSFISFQLHSGWDFLQPNKQIRNWSHTFYHWWASKPSSPLMHAALITREWLPYDLPGELWKHPLRSIPISSRKQAWFFLRKATLIHTSHQGQIILKENDPWLPPTQFPLLWRRRCHFRTGVRDSALGSGG